jgi:hypothetical protein
MADFVAVLRKTIGALGDNTPAMREKVYEKARATIEAKLAAIDPPPPAAVIDRQRKVLEDAIAAMRAEYDGPAAPREETFEDIFSSISTINEAKPAAPAPRPAAASTRPYEPAAAATKQNAPAAGDPSAIGAPEGEKRTSGTVSQQRDMGTPPPPPGRRRPAQSSSRGRTGLVAALVVALLVIGGGAYALWQNGDDLLQMAGLADDPAATADDAAVVAEDLEEAEPEPVAEEPQEEQEVAAAPAQETPPAAASEAEKFTQRLLPDGTEVDEGPAGGPRSVGEGSSVASAQVPPRTDDDAAAAAQDGTGTDPAAADAEDAPETAQAGEGEPGTPEATAEDATAQPATSAQGEQAVAVGQRAIFYEERTSSQQGSAETGAIVWSVVSESPGAELPPEPAIRAEATIPGKDVQLRMTIRRNGDETLPASHIVEMIFLTPEGFDGGAISNVARIAFKETEQAAGSPLIGIPAKIADGFFLIALGDAPAEVEANMTLLRRQSWIDIPIVYQSGRRALLSLEKGIPGDQVFQEALQAWTQESSG